MPPPEEFSPDIRPALRRAELLRDQVGKLVGVVLNNENLKQLRSDVVYTLDREHLWPQLPTADEPGRLGPVGLEPRGVDEKRWKVIDEYLGALAGTALTVHRREEVCHRIAVCIADIARGDPLPGFDRLVRHWTVLRIEHVQHTRPSEKGSAMVGITFRIMHGKWGGLCFKQRMPLRFLVFKLAREIGFPQYGTVHMLELVGAILGGEIANVDDRTIMLEFGELPRVRSFNQNLRRRRAQWCPRGFRWLCHQCSVGSLVGQPEPCPRATHPLAYHRQPCVRCKKEGWFDYDIVGESACLECIGRSAKRRARLS